MKKNTLYIFLVFFLVAFLPKEYCFGQPGALDPTFNPNELNIEDIEFTSCGFCHVTTIATQSDGKLIIAGNFTSYNGNIVNDIARLNLDGTLDNSFNAGLGLNENGYIYTLSIQQDGKIIVGGSFSSYNNSPTFNIARLNFDGSLDTTFNTGSGLNGTVNSSLIQPDGKILIGGSFSSFNGSPRNNILRLNSDGTLDPLFFLGSGANSWVMSISLQSDGKIIIAGNFSSYSGNPKNKIARLNQNGTSDPTFVTATGSTNNEILTTRIQSDGKIIVGGLFTTFYGSVSNRIVRLNSDGSVDTSFNVGLGASNVVRKIELQADGKILIVGDFLTFNGINAKSLVRLTSNGSIDSSFYLSDIGPGNIVLPKNKTVVIDDNQKVFVGGRFTSYNGARYDMIIKFNIDGSIDASFNQRNGFNSTVLTSVIQPDGKILLGGTFTAYKETAVNRIARINIDGSVDSTFNIGFGINGLNWSITQVRAISLQSDGKIIVGGAFNFFNGYTRNGLVRINQDGTIDSTFDALFSPSSQVYSTFIQPDGKILVGVDNNIRRLNQDGSQDNSFSTNLNFNVNCINMSREMSPPLFQTYQDKIIVGGSGGNLLVLNLNGSIQNNYSNFNGPIYSIVVGYGNLTGAPSIQIPYIIVGGSFSFYNNNPANNLYNFSSGGFNSNIGINGVVRSAILQPDDKVIVAGNFTSFDNVYKNRILRVNSNSTLDDSFNVTNFGANNSINTLSRTLNNELIIGGSFTTYDGVVMHGLAMLKDDPPILGKLFLDLNENCIQENNEILLNQNFTVNIEPGNYTVQAQNGIWFLDSLPAGDYIATIDTTNTNWQLTCPPSQTFTVVHPDSTTIAPSFGFLANNPCPAPNVSISMPRMRRGFGEQKIYVEACNQNTATDTIPDAYVEVQLDENISVQNASLPYTDLGNNLFRVELGTLQINQCVNFNFTTTVELSAIANQTLCIEAELFPQPSCVFDTTSNPYLTSGFTPCELPWDSSSLQINKNCSNDSVFFTITNVGSGNMECYSPVRIFIDSSLVYEDSILLNSQEDFTYSFPSDGATYRLEVDQHPLHPGISYPNASLELCGSGNWTPGIIGTMPHNDADPIIDIFCGQVSAPYDPNDKTGFPLGVGEINKIRTNQSIEYLIRFQNIGTDTAVNVVIQDTLSENFNIFTVESGVSSFPYEFSIKGQRLLEWRFNNIMLPDSISDPEGSNGFVTLKVNQVPDLPLGTVLQNTAYIYFDFEEAVITNTYTHTIGEFNISQACYGDYELVDTNFVACDSAAINGNMYYASQIIVDTIPYQFLCGKIQTTNLVINSTVIQNENIIACDSAEINGTWYYTSQEVSNTYQTLEGCDSVVVTNLVINSSVIQNETLTACDSLEFDGTWYYTSQEINNIYQTTEGCDSVVNIVINIESPEVNIVQIANNLQVASGFVAYEWSFENTVIEGANTNTLQPNLDGIYTVKVTDSNGCIEVATFNYVGTSLTNNNLQEYIKIYPNPSQGVFMVEFLNNIEPIHISVFDVSGRLIEKTVANKNIYELNLTNQASGIYFINISSNNYNFIDKLVKN